MIMQGYSPAIGRIMTKLFTGITLGDYQLKNRVFMAPLSRGRAVDNGIPNDLMAQYYAQRASAGLIIAEATAVDKKGLGWLNAPGIYNDKQQAGWQKIANAVHQKRGRIFLQLWHMGSIVHPDFIGGESPVSSSAVKQQGALTTPKGRNRNFVVPQALSKTQIEDIVQQFAGAAKRAISAGLDGVEIHAANGKTQIEDIVQQFAGAAKRAISAGLDGVEIHAANGFLIDQFTRDGINKRDDEYGGSIDNRLRFMMRIVKAVCAEIGSGKVGIRISPSNNVWGIKDSNPEATFSRAVSQLNNFSLAYLHLLESPPESQKSAETNKYLTPILRQHYQGNVLINGGYTKKSANQALINNEAEAVTFGTPFISNPRVS